MSAPFLACGDHFGQQVTARSVVSRIAWIAVASLVGNMSISAIAIALDDDGGATYALIRIAGTIPTAVILWFLARHYFKAEFWISGEIGLGVVAAQKVALALSALGGAVIAVLALALTEAFPPEMPLHDSPLAPMVSNGKVVLISWLLSSVLVAPLTEEMFFRGVLLGSLSRKLGFLTSATLSTTAFASIHVPQLGGYYSALVPIAFLGFAAAVARRLFASLWAAIALHASYNLALSLYGLLA